ncbi:MAG TPA: hypothetical protein VI336_02170, partial [Candidatus Saccharimonadales bacterium]|nr:hypothetical protein [Candidatus Saccharimonadales bacterium]
KRLSNDSILAAYGHDPAVQQESVQAVWRSKDYDRPVTVIGFMGRKDNEDCLRAEETSTGKPILTGIQRSQLEWQSLQTEVEVTDEVQEITETEKELRNQIEALQSTVQSMEERLTAFEQENKEIKERDNTLEQRNTELEEENAQLRSALVEAMEETTPSRSWRDRVKKASEAPQRAAVWWQVKRDEFMRPENRGKRRAIGAVIGALAVVGGSYMMYKLGQNSVPDIDHDALKDLQTDVNDIQDQIADPNHGLGALADQHSSIQQQIESISAPEILGGYDTQSLNSYGDTIWDHVDKTLRSELGYQPTNSQIRETTQKVLDLNGLSWADARHLRVGYDFKIPKNLSN